MAIIRFNPYHFSRNPFLPSFFDEDDETRWPELTMTDGLNIFEEEGKVVIEASVPGIPEEKLDITYEDGVLHIAGRSEDKEEEKKKNKVVHRLQRISSFDYTTYLPRPIDEKKIEATVINGVLRVTAPIAEEAKPKKITVKTHAK
jgi:HSP20 family protein